MDAERVITMFLHLYCVDCVKMVGWRVVEKMGMHQPNGDPR